MTTLTATLIALLALLPAGTRLEWKGHQVEPSKIIHELKIMDENKEVPQEEVQTPSEATPAEQPAAPEMPQNETQGVEPAQA